MNAPRTAAATSARRETRNFLVPPGDRLIPARRVRELRGGISRVTLARHVRDGVVPPPDARIAGNNFWLESRFVATGASQ
jgi:hypothetical protein